MNLLDQPPAIDEKYNPEQYRHEKHAQTAIYIAYNSATTP